MLITLAIIGVVAALTIPVVVQKYNQKAQYTAFMKMYNTLSTALSLSVVQNGDFETWSLSDQDEAAFKKYIGDYLKVSNYCTGNIANCGIDTTIPMKMLNSAGGQFTYALFNGDDVLLTLQDGAVMSGSFSVSEGGKVTHVEISADVNGPKGPNIAGRDLFYFHISSEAGNTIVYPLGLYTNDTDGIRNTLGDITGSGNNNCSTSEESDGFGCGARLLLEGKMTY